MNTNITSHSKLISRVSGLASEQSRRVAARATQEVLLHRGEEWGMWAGCGFPKSGTVWLCQLMGAYLKVPVPKTYMLPIAMPSVIHGHWRYDSRFPPTGYIYRDGRDIAVSLYFFYIRAIATQRNPRRAKQLSEQFTYMFGKNYDPDNIYENLPVFIDAEMRSPRATRQMPWHEHVESWWDKPRVGYVSYEELLADTPAALYKLMTLLTGEEADVERAAIVSSLFEFKRASGRTDGAEDRSSFLRKGVAGDWRNHFSAEAGQAFDDVTGDALISLGYEADRNWWRDL